MEGRRVVLVTVGICWNGAGFVEQSQSRVLVILRGTIVVCKPLVWVLRWRPLERGHGGSVTLVIASRLCAYLFEPWGRVRFSYSCGNFGGGVVGVASFLLSES